MKEEKSLIKLEEYKQIIEKNIPYLKVKGVSMLFESFVIVENNEESWSRIRYNFNVIDINYVIFSFTILEYIKNSNRITTPTILFEYKKDWSNTKCNIIHGKMNNDINKQTKTIDEQLQRISGIILKRRLIKK